MKKKNQKIVQVDESISSAVASIELIRDRKSLNFIETPLRGNKKVLIDVSHLHKEFGTKKKKIVAIEDSTFKIREGEHLALIGENGVGKTTTVEILEGLNKYDGGKVSYFLGEKDDKSHDQIGIQFQDSSYPPGISVKRIIKFVADAYGANISKEDLSNLLKVFGVESFYTKNASSLSGGQQQRLNVLLALIHKPKVVFLDELSTGLDITIRTEIKNFIKAYAARNNITIVLISHDMNEVQDLAERIIIMKKGKIVVQIYKDEIIKKYGNFEKFVSEYI